MIHRRALCVFLSFWLYYFRFYAHGGVFFILTQFPKVPFLNVCLRLYDSKTEEVLSGPSNPVRGTADHLGPLAPNLLAQARTLDVIFDPLLKFDKHIKTVVKRCFCSEDCNKRFTFLWPGLLKQPLFVNQPHLACSWSRMLTLMLLTGTRKRDSTTPVLVSLHWLPVKFRSEALLLVFKALHGLMPQCISELHPSNTRSLRSPRSGASCCPSIQTQASSSRTQVFL